MMLSDEEWTHRLLSSAQGEARGSVAADWGRRGGGRSRRFPPPVAEEIKDGTARTAVPEQAREGPAVWGRRMGGVVMEGVRQLWIGGVVEKTRVLNCARTHPGATSAKAPQQRCAAAV
eukprot:Hpha_TRINITY_DN15734_c2_g5::TRINITY_DN15734_c2_g5_i1::g.40409::m.40409